MKQNIISILMIFLFLGCAAPDLKKESKDFSVDVQNYVTKKKADSSSVVDIAESINQKKHYSKSLLKIQDVALEDFLRVIFTECLKLPYVLDRSVVQMNKRIDIEINNKRNHNLFSVVVALLDNYQIEVQDVDGVILITSKAATGASAAGSPSGMPSDKSSVKGVVPSDNVYAYRPLYMRAKDLKTIIGDLLQNDLSKVVVSEQNNQLIFRSTNKERLMIIKLLRELDRKQSQVCVDVTLAEVSLTGDLSIGLEGFLKKNEFGLELGVNENNGYGITGSIIIGDWFKAVVQMGEKRGLIRVKSNPYMVIADGSNSSIEVGSEYPTLSAEKSTGDTSMISSVVYRKTGIILNLLPVVSGDQVHLTANLEMSEGKQNDVSTINSPAILSRKIKYEVVLEDGQSLMVGGLISTNISHSDTFFMGKVQTGKHDIKNQSEIVLIVKVNIVKDNDDDWFRVLKRKYGKIENGIGINQ